MKSLRQHHLFSDTSSHLLRISRVLFVGLCMCSSGRLARSAGDPNPQSEIVETTAETQVEEIPEGFRCGEQMCSPHHAGAQCVRDRCELTCHNGYRDCDGDTANGCEEKSSDGSCAKCSDESCTNDEVCVEKDQGLWICETLCVNGAFDPSQESDTDCGGSCLTYAKCNAGQFCRTQEDCADGLMCSVTGICAPNVCNPADPPLTFQCERCGTRRMTCNSFHQWAIGATCDNQGECQAGSREDEGEGRNRRHRICDAGCKWGPYIYERNQY